MTFKVYIVSRFDESERPYVSTTAPTPEREEALRRDGYSVHAAIVHVHSCSDHIPAVPALTEPHRSSP